MVAIDGSGSRQMILGGDEGIKTQPAGYSAITYGLFYDENKGVD